MNSPWRQQAPLLQNTAFFPINKSQIKGSSSPDCGQTNNYVFLSNRLLNLWHHLLLINTCCVYASAAIEIVSRTWVALSAWAIWLSVVHPSLQCCKVNHCKCVHSRTVLQQRFEVFIRTLLEYFQFPVLLHFEQDHDALWANMLFLSRYFIHWKLDKMAKFQAYLTFTLILLLKIILNSGLLLPKEYFCIVVLILLLKYFEYFVFFFRH